MIAKKIVSIILFITAVSLSSIAFFLYPTDEIESRFQNQM